MSIRNQRRAPCLNEIGEEITDAELNNVSGGDKATTTKTTKTTTTTTTTNTTTLTWIELYS
jgi:bacteriocin-like protein